MLYFIGIVPPEPLYSTLNPFKQRHQHFSSPPHITLKAQNGLGNNGWLEALAQVAARTKPFEVTLSGVGYFGSEVIYLKPHAPQITELHQNILKTLNLAPEPSYFEGELFVPHLTLWMQQNASPSQFSAAEADILHTFTPSYTPQFKASSFTVFQQANGEKSYQVYKEFQFSVT